MTLPYEEQPFLSDTLRIRKFSWVVFQTQGRGGFFQERKGKARGLKNTKRGAFVEIRTPEGLTVYARPAKVRLYTA